MCIPSQNVVHVTCMLHELPNIHVMLVYVSMYVTCIQHADYMNTNMLTTCMLWA